MEKLNRKGRGRKKIMMENKKERKGNKNTERRRVREEGRKKGQRKEKKSLKGGKEVNE